MVVARDGPMGPASDLHVGPYGRIASTQLNGVNSRSLSDEIKFRSRPQLLLEIFR